MSKTASIFTSIILYVSGLMLISVIGLGIWLYEELVAPLEPQFLGQSLSETYIDIEKRMSNKLEEGKAIAVAVTAYHGVQEGLAHSDPDQIFEDIANIQQHFASTSKYQNILTRVVNHRNEIMATAWDKTLMGDLIQSPLLAEMQATQKVTANYGISEKGFGAIAYAPVVVDGHYLGAVQSFSGVAAVAKDLKELGIDWVLLLDKNYLKQHYGKIPDSVKNNQTINNDYLVAHPKWFDQNAIDFIINNHYSYAIADGYDVRLIGDKALINVPLYDENYQVIGRHILIKTASMIEQRIAETQSHIISIQIIMTVLLLFIVGIVLLIVKHRAINPMIHLVDRIEQIVEDGQFGIKLPVYREDEVGRVYIAMNHLLSSLDTAMIEIENIVHAQADGDLSKRSTSDLHGQLEEVQHSINNASDRLSQVVSHAVSVSYAVSEAANQVSKGAMTLSSRVQEQAAALEETTATMTEMTATVEANTENANQVANIAVQVQRNANQGFEVMHKAISAMQSIQDSSKKISDIVSMINDISMKTNMLALNASVEAARAGEHGHGFAVVAIEVKNLAIKSANAAKDIKTLIDDSVQRVEHGTGYVEQSGAMFDDIKKSLDDVANMIKEIALASTEQSSSIAHIYDAITEIDRITQENSALVEETTTAAESLNHEAQQLRSNMSYFKVK